MTASKRASASLKKTKAGQWNEGPWSKKEHSDFKKGICTKSWGKWTEISKIVITRSPDQVKSHAQKYASKFPVQTDFLKKKIYAEDLYGELAPRKNAKKISEKGKEKPKRRSAPAKTKAAKSKNAEAQHAAKLLAAALRSLTPEQASVLVSIAGHAATAEAGANAAPASVAEANVPANEVLAGANVHGTSLPTAGQVVENHFGQLRRNAFVPIHVPVREGVRVSPSPSHAPAREDVVPVREDMHRDPTFDEYVERMDVRNEAGVPRNLIYVDPHQYDEIKKVVTAPVNYMNPDEYYVLSDGLTRRGIDWGTAMRNRIKELIQGHVDDVWWTGGLDSVSSPGWNQPKSELVAHNEKSAKNLVALLVVMYDCPHWRSPAFSYPHNLTEIDGIMSVIHKAYDMWIRIKLSLARGHYSLFGGHAGWELVRHVDSVVGWLMQYGQSLADQFSADGGTSFRYAAV